MARKAKTTHRAGYRLKKLGINGSVRRNISTAGVPSFVACVEVRKPAATYHRLSDRWPKTTTCQQGRNPRVALAATFRSLAKKVEGRRGTFAALDGYSRTHRKIRRHRRAGKRRY